jgi:hypothetical protein
MWVVDVVEVVMWSWSMVVVDVVECGGRWETVG